MVSRCFGLDLKGMSTWYLVSNVLQTPVSSIIATRNGTAALTAMISVFGAPSELRWDGLRCLSD